MSVRHGRHCTIAIIRLGSQQPQSQNKAHIAVKDAEYIVGTCPTVHIIANHMRGLVRKKGFSGAVKNRHTAQSGLAPNAARQKYCDWTVTGERAVCCWHFLPSLARLSSRCRPISIVLFLRRDEEVALVFRPGCSSSSSSCP